MKKVFKTVSRLLLCGMVAFGLSACDKKNDPKPEQEQEQTENNDNNGEDGVIEDNTNKKEPYTAITSIYIDGEKSWEYDYDAEGREIGRRGYSTIDGQTVLILEYKDYRYRDKTQSYTILGYNTDGTVLSTNEVSYIYLDDDYQKLVKSYTNGEKSWEYDYDTEGREIGRRGYSTIDGQTVLMHEYKDYRYRDKTQSYTVLQYNLDGIMLSTKEVSYIYLDDDYQKLVKSYINGEKTIEVDYDAEGREIGRRSYSTIDGQTILLLEYKNYRYGDKTQSYTILQYNLDGTVQSNREYSITYLY